MNEESLQIAKLTLSLNVLEKFIIHCYWNIWILELITKEKTSLTSYWVFHMEMMSYFHRFSLKSNRCQIAT